MGKASRDKAIQIELAGVPVGKGRPRFVRATGRAYTPDKTRRFESDLRLAAQEAMAGRAPLEGPVGISIYASFPVPQSWSRKKREQALLSIIRPTTKPDADNLLKACDALNQVVFRDDSQIVSASIEKDYSDRPRLSIFVESLDWFGDEPAASKTIHEEEK
jgi:Holliday junction resolvase RusA-like endonuclease